MNIRDKYFEWMSELVCGDRFSKETSYRKLLKQLHRTEFRYHIPRDVNRWEDGVSLRRRFAYENSGIEYVEDFMHGPCTVLEMMVALAIRCEEWMDDTSMGDRTGQWFWRMIVSLGLGSMTDDRFDITYIEMVVDRFLDREYESNGKGGLFTIKNTDRDMRLYEIWFQMCWYLDSLM